MINNIILFSSISDLIKYKNIDINESRLLFVSPLKQKYSYNYNNKFVHSKSININKKILLHDVKRKHSLITYYNDPNSERVNLEIDLDYNKKLIINVKFTFIDE